MLRKRIFDRPRCRLTRAKLASVVFVLTAISVNSEVDHLIPLDIRYLEPNARQMLARKLFASPANYGRLVVIPPGIRGEQSVAIYSDSKSPTGFVVTCTEAETNVCNATSKDTTNRKNEDEINVRRTDIFAPKSMCMAVSQAVHKMVSNTAPADLADRFVDGTTLWFSANVEGKTIEGLLTEEIRGPSATLLRQVADELVDYCAAPTSERLKYGNRVEETAKRLIDRSELGP